MSGNAFDNKQVCFKGEVMRCVCDRDGFKIYAMNVDAVRYRGVKLNKYGNVSIAGDLPELSMGIEYEVRATPKQPKNPAYDTTYYVDVIRRNQPLTREGVRTFLEEVTSVDRAAVIADAYPNIIELVKEGRTHEIDTDRLKGIGEHSLAIIIDKITQNFHLSDIVAEFNGVLSFTMVKKLYDKYKSVDMLKSALVKEPYTTLTNVNGIGFKKADDMVIVMQDEGILDFEYDIKTSQDRCHACIMYVLGENENEGNTKMDISKLLSAVKDLAPECIDTFSFAMNNNDIWFDTETKEVALSFTRDMEEYVATTVADNLDKWTDNKWQCDTERYREVDGFKLSDEQMGVLDMVNNSAISVLNGAAGCVDCDTEFFTGTEWKRIADYEHGDKVLQYNEDSTAELVYPLRYIKQHADYLWHFETKYGLDQCLSDNHECYYITSKGNLYHKPFKEVREGHQNIKTGFSGKFITSFAYGGSGINLTDDEIRLMVATFADGSFYGSNKDNAESPAYNRARFHVKKDRKKKRLIELAKAAGVSYRMTGSAAEGYNDIYIDVPFRAKHYPPDWYNCTNHQLNVIADEVMFWDGNHKENNRYSTTSKDDADFIQFVYAATGRRATIHKNDRSGQEHLTCGSTYVRKSAEYSVSYTDRTLIGICNDSRPDHKKTDITEYKTKDGYEYCFTVPSHMLILRRNNKIFITGNCGKSSAVSALIAMLDDMDKSYMLMAPTGKAAKVLQSVTNRPVSTIHRAIGYSPTGLWEYNENNHLDVDVIIVDETSMVDVYLFWRLIQAIDFAATKLLLIGDDAQLPSVGCGNVFHDLMESNLIPTTTLTKVFRYGDGGVMKVATDIRMSTPYLPSSIRGGFGKFGNNADYVFYDISTDDKDERVAKYESRVVSIYKKLIESGCPLSDIQVINAKNVGEYGADKYNKLLQKVANKNCGSDNFFKSGDNMYYVGDIVMQCSNNYKAPTSEIVMSSVEIRFYRENKDVEWPTCFVANGESGKVVSVSKDFIDIDFGNGCVVQYNHGMAQDIKLGYAITTHKSQGSGFNNVILVTAKSDTFTLNSNLLYVGVTRSKKRCFHVGSVDTVNKVIKKKADMTRNTFMTDMLRKRWLENNDK